MVSVEDFYVNIKVPFYDPEIIKRFALDYLVIAFLCLFLLAVIRV